ncbi:ATP-binding protein [Imhoffiella purpurea]|uniref:histidine kinase n=1 Tax=Imhoffiella purpurea TaxID=1249627 RepID=W9W3S3_9GAMM|nr:ATP-binding protein [Imhoffiella purpurea]EXJ17210.1 Periplasmic Sensor Signal Transduction Histidine Kinase [Imhoffiella purpurea]
MSHRRQFLPATLFGRALLTLIFTFGLYAVVALGVTVAYALVPVAHRSAADLASIMVLSARTLQQLPPDLRETYRSQLASEYQIRLVEERPQPDSHRYFFPYLPLVERALTARMGHEIEMTANLTDGERWFWAEIDVEGHPLWAGFPRSRLGTRPLQGLAVIATAAVLLILGTTIVLAGRLSSPLKRLSKAAEQVALGLSPRPLPETGPVELANLAHQFNETGRQIRELLANRTLLLTGISHDLRTPLTRLRLAIAMLPDDTPPTLVARMERDIEEMNALITQAIEFGKSLGAGRRDEVDLSALVDDLIAGRPRLVWRKEPPCASRVDALALRRILGNLIENALTYSRHPVEIRLGCSQTLQQILVLDRGPGIPESEREAVLRPYYRSEPSRSRQGGGSGLGLAVAQQLALANQIELRLGLRPGGGTVASIRLPSSSLMKTSRQTVDDRTDAA